MKKNKRICTLTLAALCIVNLFQTPVIANANKVSGGYRLKGIVERQIEKNEQSIVQQDEKEETFEKVHEAVLVDKENEIYIESYGGMYYDDDQKLVVQTTHDEGDEVEEIIDATDEEVVIEEVEYSYNELKEDYSDISEHFCELVDETSTGELNSDLQELADNMNGVSIDVENNTVVVYLENDTEEAEEQFKECYGVENVEFEETEAAEDETTLVKLGQAIYTTTSRGSVGMKAYYINSKGEKVKGFVTAGHMGKVGDPIYINGCSNTKIGKITKQQYKGKIDAAFVKITNSSYAPSRKVYYANSSGKVSDKYTLYSYSYLSDTYVGAYLYKAGSTTYLTRGKVVSTCSTMKVASTNTVFTDLWQANYVSAGGDSGGAVFDVNCNCIAGIHKGHGTYSYAVKWGNITDAWDLYEY